MSMLVNAFRLMMSLVSAGQALSLQSLSCASLYALGSCITDLIQEEHCPRIMDIHSVRFFGFGVTFS